MQVSKIKTSFQNLFNPTSKNDKKASKSKAQEAKIDKPQTELEIKISKIEKEIEFATSEIKKIQENQEKTLNEIQNIINNQSNKRISNDDFITYYGIMGRIKQSRLVDFGLPLPGELVFKEENEKVKIAGYSEKTNRYIFQDETQGTCYEFINNKIKKAEYIPEIPKGYEYYMQQQMNNRARKMFFEDGKIQKYQEGRTVILFDQEEKPKFYYFIKDVTNIVDGTVKRERFYDIADFTTEERNLDSKNVTINGQNCTLYEDVNEETFKKILK